MQFFRKICIAGAVAILYRWILPAIRRSITIPVAVRVRSIPDIVQVDAVHVRRSVARMRCRSSDELVIAVVGGGLERREASRWIDGRPGSLVDDQIIRVARTRYHCSAGAVLIQPPIVSLHDRGKGRIDVVSRPDVDTFKINVLEDLGANRDRKS